MLPSKSDEGLVLKCRKCGFEKASGTDAYKIVKKIERSPKTETVILRDEIDYITLPTVSTECPKCGNRKAFYWTLQTRRADESETRFYRCTKCSNVWREYD